MAFVTCRECGTSISDKATACPKCGAPQSKVPIRECVHCGAELPPRVRKCRECGEFQTPQQQTQALSKKKATSNNTSNSNMANTLLTLLVIVGVIVGGYLIYEEFFPSQEQAIEIEKEKEPVILIPEGNYMRVRATGKLGNKLERLFVCKDLVAAIGVNLTIRKGFLESQVLTDVKRYKIERGSSPNQYFIRIKNLDQDGDLNIELQHINNGNLRFVCGQNELIYIRR
ncbi:MAG: zinc ribbon domain-containing protein [Bacteroidetes bacterium]|nr:zinc ribbon domain-containing protein [Bacteroidota bacterium]